ncbi:membrane-spanning 4-domains subfamily A member 4A [Myripristis murdjan]|uniref:membrane-spanning 4-domains subfamily A member 4A n=1 Tax=Myripristis murdjan TaxID=586833 RepID=UPI0011762702|nr:membrane-spanning 4-domains subfamily A member 4A-like [Myripristis murdjan]XP_029928293.1 membrane-spanning 4-domains subfamily A member 4A-like [Myripristis murdjan]
MAYTSITTAGGVVVVTQVFPQGDEEKVPILDPSAAPLLAPSGPARPTPPTAPAKPPNMTATFLKGEPQALGIVQIFVGLMCVLFSLTALVSHHQMVHAPLAAGLAFVVSGSVAVAARRGTAVGLIWATLTCSVVSTLLAVAAAAYLCTLMATRAGQEELCGDVMSKSRMRRDCDSMQWRLNRVMDGLRGLILALLALQICVAVSLSVFSSRALSRRGSSAPDTVAVESCDAPAVSPTTALLASVAEETACEPPPYYP